MSGENHLISSDPFEFQIIFAVFKNRSDTLLFDRKNFSISQACELCYVPVLLGSTPGFDLFPNL